MSQGEETGFTSSVDRRMGRPAHTATQEPLDHAGCSGSHGLWRSIGSNDAHTWPPLGSTDSYASADPPRPTLYHHPRLARTRRDKVV